MYNDHVMTQSVVLVCTASILGDFQNLAEPFGFVGAILAASCLVSIIVQQYRGERNE